MSEEVIKHGFSYIWDLEIDSYIDIYLDDFYTDTVIDFEYLYCDEMYIGLHGLRRYKDSNWQISVPIGNFIGGNTLEQACEELSKHCSFLLNYTISKHEYLNHEITILINRNMSIYDAYNYAIEVRDSVIDYANSLGNHTFSTMVKQKIVEQLPIYLRAMKKVELELSNFATVDIGNKHKIIEICSRVKEISSIEEKVYRKSICQFDVFERFDDIAGVRCTCEFLSDVYDVLSYIRENPLFRVYDIEDIIEKPSKTGYRGIHVIVTTDVYYHGSLYKDIKVEVQLRTAFQNAWSMKTHQLTYKRESAIPEEISVAMKEMSDALKNADDVAQRIKGKLRNGE